MEVLHTPWDTHTLLCRSLVLTLGNQGNYLCGGKVRADLQKDESDICVYNRMKGEKLNYMALLSSPTHLLLQLSTSAENSGLNFQQA